MKGKMSMSAILLIIVVLGIAGYYFYTQGAISTQTFSPTTTLGAGEVIKCGAGTILYANVVAYNPLNSSTDYPPVSVVVTDSSGNIIASGTTTYSTTTKTYAAITVPCSQDAISNGVMVYGLAGLSPNVTSGASGLKSFGGGNYVAADLVVPRSSELWLVTRDTALANTSSSGYSTVSNKITENAATAMSAGETRSFYIDVQPSGGSRQFGSDSGGVVVAIDTVDATAFTDKALSLSATGSWQLTEVACSMYPNVVSQLSANRCYKASALKASAGLQRIYGTLENDGGTSAGATSDPIIYMCDVQYGTDVSGARVIQDCFKSDGTNLGEINPSITLDNS